ncbi:hypothetical protein BC834DRAFT_674826 [Gloeopeniophorella convolvens]|nr:hypothetical protein BC834DRAFT_674826 [Gloeopeniophorella convolvens]
MGKNDHSPSIVRERLACLSSLVKVLLGVGGPAIPGKIWLRLGSLSCLEDPIIIYKGLIKGATRRLTTWAEEGRLIGRAARRVDDDEGFFYVQRALQTGPLMYARSMGLWLRIIARIGRERRAHSAALDAPNGANADGSAPSYPSRVGSCAGLGRASVHTRAFTISPSKESRFPRSQGCKAFLLGEGVRERESGPGRYQAMAVLSQRDLAGPFERDRTNDSELHVAIARGEFRRTNSASTPIELCSEPVAAGFALCNALATRVPSDNHSPC